MLTEADNYNGRIEEPWMLGVAGGAAILGEAIKPLGSTAWRAIKPTAVGQALQSAGSSIKAGAGKVFRVAGSGGRVATATAGELSEAGAPVHAADARQCAARHRQYAEPHPGQRRPPAPARSRNRAFAGNEGNLPEPALDTRARIQASSRRFLLSPNVIGDGKSAEQALKDYFRDAVQVKLEKSNALRRQQFFGGSEYLRKAKPDALNPGAVIY